MNIFNRRKSTVAIAQQLDVSKVYIFQVSCGPEPAGFDGNAEYERLIQRMCHEGAEFSALWSLAQRNKVEIEKNSAILVNPLQEETKEKILFGNMVPFAMNMLEDGYVHKPIRAGDKRLHVGWLEAKRGELFLQVYVFYFDGEQ